MPTPKLSREVAEDAIARVEAKLREGHVPSGMMPPSGQYGAIKAAATQAHDDGICGSKSAFLSRIVIAKALYGLEPDWTLYRALRFAAPIPKAAPVVPVNEHMPPSDTSLTRMLVIPDLHQDPRHPHRLKCLAWIARFGAAVRTPWVVQLGDWSTWDSVSTHDKPGTRGAFLKPTIQADMDNLKDSLAVWQKEKGDWKPRQIVTLGNHENRLERFENVNPESIGIHTGARDALYKGYGWRCVPYGQQLYVDNVAFTHHMTNGAGQAIGGKTGPTRAANDAGCSFVHGHTHQWRFWAAAKHGPTTGIDILEAGCAMDWGEVEQYAMHSLVDWWYGVTVIGISGGRIVDVDRVSMITLRARYG